MADRPGSPYAEHVVFGVAGMDSYGLAPVPQCSPYQVGDWVVRHGYPGNPEGSGRTGFRGFVTGGYGAQILRGLTDDGGEWAESWGALWPDGSPCPDLRCACCPRLPAVASACVVQLDLFNAA